MATTKTIEVWVVIDEAGDYATGTSEDAAAERYDEDVGGSQGSTGLRRVRVELTIPLPTPIAVQVTVPAPDEDVTVTVS